MKTVCGRLFHNNISNKVVAAVFIELYTFIQGICFTYFMLIRIDLRERTDYSLKQIQLNFQQQKQVGV